MELIKFNNGVELEENKLYFVLSKSVQLLLAFTSSEYYTYK